MGDTRVYKSTSAQLEKARLYRLQNPEKVKAMSARWRAKNKEYRQSPEWKEKSRQYANEWRKKNAEKSRAYHKKYEDKNREKIKEFHRKHKLTEKYAATRTRLHLARKFKMTVEQYNLMLEAQGGVCKICKLTCVSKRRGREKAIRPLSVDHDHKTGRIRGLLCSTCNSGLGLFKDNPELLDQAALYLRRISGRH